MLEIDLERLFKKTVESAYGLALKFWPLSFTGFPDRIALLPGGRIFFVELKRPATRTTRATKVKIGGKQDYVRNLLRGLGFEVWEIGTIEKLKEFENRITIKIS